MLSTLGFIALIIGIILVICGYTIAPPALRPGWGAVILGITPHPHRLPTPRPTQRRGGLAPMINCCICLNRDAVLTPAAVIHDGYSLCYRHQCDVINKIDGMWFNTDGRFNLAATLEDMGMHGVVTT